MVAVVRQREGSAPLGPAAVQDHCRRHLAGYKVPRRLVLTDRIQRSPSGKADYRWAKAVATAANASEGAGPGPATLGGAAGRQP